MRKTAKRWSVWFAMLFLLGIAQVNIRNLFGVRFFEGAQSRVSVIPGAPLTVLGTVGVRF